MVTKDPVHTLERNELFLSKKKLFLCLGRLWCSKQIHTLYHVLLIFHVMSKDTHCKYIQFGIYLVIQLQKRSMFLDG